MSYNNYLFYNYYNIIIFITLHITINITILHINITLSTHYIFTHKYNVCLLTKSNKQIWVYI